jgi:hypothetical protein
MTHKKTIKQTHFSKVYLHTYVHMYVHTYVEFPLTALAFLSIQRRARVRVQIAHICPYACTYMCCM